MNNTRNGQIDEIVKQLSTTIDQLDRINICISSVRECEDEALINEKHDAFEAEMMKLTLRDLDEAKNKIRECKEPLSTAITLLKLSKHYDS